MFKNRLNLRNMIAVTICLTGMVAFSGCNKANFPIVGELDDRAPVWMSEKIFAQLSSEKNYGLLKVTEHGRMNGLTRDFSVFNKRGVLGKDLMGSSKNSEIERCYIYLKEQGQSPEKYLISKFEEYDYVFLGEYHRLKQDVDFVVSLIPDLYQNGIRNIAYEFYQYANQNIVDSLLTAKEWNEKILYHNLSKGFGVMWGYSEYLDLFKKVWEFNQTLKPEQPKFRIVLLGYEYNPCKSGLEMFGGHDPDAFHADVFEKEIISKNEKALVYCGIHHAFTTYNQPSYDFEKAKFYGFVSGRFGNIINRKYPKKTFTIFLHSPWASDKGWDEQYVKPVNGAIDSVMTMFNNLPMGFDVKNTVIGNLKATDTYYAIGYNNFKLENFCDGYIFLQTYKKMEFVSVAPNYYDEYNLSKVKDFLKCRGFSEEDLQKTTQESAIEILTEHLENHFGDLVK